MLVSKQITNRKTVVPQSFTIGDAVRVLPTNQIGVLESRKGARWGVRLTEGSVIECEQNDLERRQLLTG